MTSPARKTLLIRRLFKPLVFFLCLTPLVVLAWNGFTGNLSANPISDIQNETGIWTLRLLVATLAVTPLRRITKIHTLIRFRRMVGLFAFFYGCLHFTTYIWLDQFFDWHSILHDIPKRPFITVGFASFILMIPLTVTSTKNMIRRLGGRKWNLLHRLVYVTAIGGVIHYLWLVKADTQRPITYGIIIAVLFASRLWIYFASRFSSSHVLQQKNFQLSKQEIESA
jgi:sulfoxide reductase heme-binding subunit YedZ